MKWFNQSWNFCLNSYDFWSECAWLSPYLVLALNFPCPLLGYSVPSFLHKRLNVWFNLLLYIIDNIIDLWVSYRHFSLSSPLTNGLPTSNNVKSISTHLSASIEPISMVQKDWSLKSGNPGVAYSLPHSSMSSHSSASNWILQTEMIKIVSTSDFNFNVPIHI